MNTIEEIQYWMDTKKAYETSLQKNVGHTESIIQILSKIDSKIIELNK